jgi:hypothetical protein
MSFKTVFYALLDVFPQVKNRNFLFMFEFFCYLNDLVGLVTTGGLTILVRRTLRT